MSDPDGARAGVHSALSAAGSSLSSLLGGRGGAADVEGGATQIEDGSGGGVFGRLLGRGEDSGDAGASSSSSAAASRWGKLRAAIRLGSLSGDEDEETTELRRLAESVSGYFKMSYETRVKGFAICLGVAILCSLTSWILLFSFALSTFAIVYSLGNAFGLASTFFLMGPLNQLKRMFSKRRWISASVYLSCLFATLYFALVAQVFVLVLVFMVLQWLALWWYALSYIPGAQRVVGGCVRTCFDMD